MNAPRLLTVGATVCLLGSAVALLKPSDLTEFSQEAVRRISRESAAPSLIVSTEHSAVRGDDKLDYAKLIVGKWEVTKADEWAFPKGAWIVFTKDGKAKTTGVQEDVEIAVEGSYKVEHDTLTLALKHGDLDKRQTLTIISLSDREMTTKDKDGKVVEWEKK